MCAFLIPRVSGEDLSVGNIQVGVFRCLLLAESCRTRMAAIDPKQPVDPKNKCVLFSNFD